MHTIAVVNEKGGVAKTTTVLNLGVALALLGRRVLLVDLDPQATLTENLDYRRDSHRPSIRDVLAAEGALPIAATLLAAPPGMALVPAGRNLVAARRELDGTFGREYFLRDALPAVAARFDYALLDCPPSLDVLTINALAAADRVLVPVSTEYNSLFGLANLDTTLGQVRARVNPRLGRAAILPTLHSARHTVQRGVLEQLRADWGGDYHLFAPIPRATAFVQASAHFQSVVAYAPHSPGALAYTQLAKEIDDAETGTAPLRPQSAA